MSISTKLISSVLIEKVIEDFRKLYEERFGKCFRTEIRDTGVFVCGVHHSSVWDDPDSECLEFQALLELIGDAFDSSVDRTVVSPKPNPTIVPAPYIPPTKVSPFDGTRWPNSVPPNSRYNPDRSQPRSTREAVQEFDLWDANRDSYNLPI